MDKKHLYVDCDNTIIDTNSAFCAVYNELYINHPDFKTAEPDDVKFYNFSDVCPLLKDVMEIFENPLFFKFAELINNNTYEVLEKLNHKYKIIVASIGTPKNIVHKALYLEKKLPFIKDYVFIVNSKCHMDKSIINCPENSIFIDDIPSNLLSVNSRRKILFGKLFPWNNVWSGEWAKDWTEVAEKLL